MSDDVAAIQGLIRRFHEAWGQRDGEAAMSCWEVTGFAVAGGGTDDPSGWSPQRAWRLDPPAQRAESAGEPEAKSPEPSSYSCNVEFRRIDVAHDLALVSTYETGTAFDGQPFAGRNVWFVSRAAGDWRLLGVIYRDRRADG